MMRRLTTTASKSSLPSIKLISVEGNIGAGKTTLLNLMKSRSLSYVHFLDEPVGVWESIKNEANESLLQVYYKDPKRWSYTFQSCALLSRYQTLANAVDKVLESSSSSSSSSLRSSESESSSSSSSSSSECVLIIAERCLDTDYNVFTKMLCDEGCIDKMEFDIYNRLYQHLQSESIPLSGIIHVDTDPHECLSRIKGRSRPGEETIPLDYLKKLDKYQRQWITSTHIPSITTTADPQASINQIERFMTSLSGGTVPSPVTSSVTL